MKKLAPFAVLLLSMPAFAQNPPATSAVPQGAAQAMKESPSYSVNPSGEGEPFLVTCRAPQTLPGSRLKGPEVCKANQVWAQYRRDGMEPAADGIHDVRGEKWRSIHPPVCHPATMGGGSTIAMGYAVFTPICD